MNKIMTCFTLDVLMRHVRTVKWIVVGRRDVWFPINQSLVFINMYYKFLYESTSFWMGLYQLRTCDFVRHLLSSKYLRQPLKKRLNGGVDMSIQLWPSNLVGFFANFDWYCLILKLPCYLLPTIALLEQVTCSTHFEDDCIIIYIILN